MHLMREPDEYLLALNELAVALYGFDANVLAAQAQIALNRVERSGGLDPYFSLFDCAQARSRPNWRAVTDHKSAIVLLLRLFSFGPSQAGL
jgi:hypothetical protein